MCACWVPGRVTAADHSVLIGVRDAASSSLAARAQAETESAGFKLASREVVQVGDTDTDGLVRLMDREGVRALLLFAETGDGAHLASVLVTDPVSGSEHFRRIDRRAEGGEASVALQAVEVLRAAWAEAGLLQPKTSLVTASAPAERNPSDPPQLSLIVANGVSYSPGGVAPTWKIGAEVELYARRWLGTAVAVAGTPFGAASDREVALRLRHASLAAGPVFRLLPTEDTRVWLSPELGVIAVWTTLDGADGKATWGAVAGLRAAAGAALSPRASLRVNLRAQSFVEPARIKVDGERIARFGLPVLDGSLSVDFKLR